MPTVQDTYVDAAKLATQEGSEVAGGLLLPQNLDEGVCLDFDGSASYVNIGNAGSSIQSVAFWICPDDTTSRGVIELSSGNRIDIGSNVISTTGLTGAVVYVDGIVTTAMATAGRWYHVVVTFTAAETVSACTLGLANSVYFDGKLDGVIFFTSLLTAEQVQKLYSTGVNPESPVNHWKMNDGSGATVTDSGSGADNGDMTGHLASWTTSHNPFYARRARATSTDLVTGLGATAINSLAYTIGKKPGGSQAKLQFSSDGSTWKNANGDLVSNSGGYSFDGVDDEITVTLSGVGTINSLTFSMWVRASSFASYRPIFIDATNRRGVILSGGALGHLTYLWENTFDEYNAITGAALSLGNWHFVTVVITPTAASVYLDGSLRFTNTKTHNTKDMNKFWSLGRDSAVGSRFWHGSMDDVRLYNVALSASEVWDLFSRHKDAYTSSSQRKVWWKLNGNATDSSGNGNNGTLSGSTALTEFSSLPEFGEPVSEENDVLRFDGVNDVVRVGVSNFRGSDFAGTIQAWVRRDGTGTRDCIFGSADEVTNTGYYFLLMLETTGELVIAQRNNDTATEYKTTATIPTGAWTHVAVTSNGTAYTLYINGVAQSATGTNNGDWFGDTANRDNITIGLLDTSTDYDPFVGAIANIAIYNAALSAAQILTDFQNGYPSATNRVAYWKLNEGTGTTANDTDGSNHGTISGATWQKDIARPQPGTPAQQTINLTGLGFTSAVYYRALWRAYNHDRALALDETTLDYTAAAGNAERRTLRGVMRGTMRGAA